MPVLGQGTADRCQDAEYGCHEGRAAASHQVIEGIGEPASTSLSSVMIGWKPHTGYTDKTAEEMYGMAFTSPTIQ
jgi:hypothetical protein